MVVIASLLMSATGYSMPHHEETAPSPVLALRVSVYSLYTSCQSSFSTHAHLVVHPDAQNGEPAGGRDVHRKLDDASEDDGKGASRKLCAVTQHFGHCQLQNVRYSSGGTYTGPILGGPMLPLMYPEVVQQDATKQELPLCAEDERT